MSVRLAEIVAHHFEATPRLDDIRVLQQPDLEVLARLAVSRDEACDQRLSRIGGARERLGERRPIRELGSCGDGFIVSVNARGPGREGHHHQDRNDASPVAHLRMTPRASPCCEC